MSDLKKPIVLAVVNQKGGVGKTTISRETGSCLALRGYKTLLIDCDPQANLTATLVTHDFVQENLTDVMIPRAVVEGRRARLPLSQVIIEGPVNNLDFVASDGDLVGFDREHADLLYHLRLQIAAHCKDYDFVILDCPPYYGNLQTGTLYAAKYVLIPCAPLVVGMDGLEGLGLAVNRAQAAPNPQLEVLGVVINLFKPRRKLAKMVRDKVVSAVEKYGLTRVFDNNLNDYAEIAEAPASKMPLVIYAPGSRASKQMWLFTEEILTLLGMPVESIQSPLVGVSVEQEIKSGVAGA